MRKSLIAALAILLMATGVAGPADPPEEASLEQRIKDLSRRARKSGAPDSLKYELALLRAEAGTIEDRYQALRLLDNIRRTYQNESRYHRDFARIFIDAQQPSRAIASLEKVVELEPTDVDSRVLIARLMLQELLYHYDLRTTGEMLSWLDSALDIDPNHRDALFLASLALELGTGLPDGSADLSVRGRILAEKILHRDKSDTAARLLLALHEMNLGNHNEAKRAFDFALNNGPEDVRNAFYAMDLTAPDRAMERARAMDPEMKSVFDQAYWLYQDPTPITLLNENQLEIWKRLTLSEFLFGKPEKGLRGWDVPAGEAYVRFGPPKAHDFDPGEIQGQGGARDRSSIKLVPPAWSWNYEFRNASFDLKFEDKSLNGNFLMDGATEAKMTVLRKRAPVVYDDATPGYIRYLYVSSAGRMETAKKVKQSIHLAVPFWRPSKKLDWLDEVLLEIDVESTTRKFTRRSQRRARATDVFPLVDDMNVLLVSSDFSLLPGRYKVTAYVRDDDKKVHGIFSTPIEVRDYGAEPSLTIADLELSFARPSNASGATTTTLGEKHTPNPLSLVGDERNLEIFYELYGLTPRDGAANHQARYTIVPRDFLLEFEYCVDQGLFKDDELVFFAASGGGEGSLSLGTDDFMDVTFPPSPLTVKNGRAPKATRLKLGALVPGEYALITTVRNVDTEEVASARTAFRIFTDDEIRSLLSFSRGEN